LKEDGEKEAEKDKESRMFDRYFSRQLLFVTSNPYSATDVWTGCSTGNDK